MRLLDDARYQFAVEPAHLDEERHAKSTMPIELAMELARAKGEIISAKFPDDVILAADTVVALGDWIIGKPRNAAHARTIIELLSGATHIVITGVSVICRATGFAQTIRDMSSVQMKVISPRDLDAYIESKHWEGKAGGYGIQDPEPIVKCLHGDPTNVMGLPMNKTRKLLAEAGIVPYS
jgi:septum formation protein